MTLFRRPRTPRRRDMTFLAYICRQVRITTVRQSSDGVQTRKASRRKSTQNPSVKALQHSGTDFGNRRQTDATCCKSNTKGQYTSQRRTTRLTSRPVNNGSSSMHRTGVYIMRNPTGSDYKAFRRQLDAVSAMQIQVTEDLSAKDQFARHADFLTISQESYISWRRDNCGNSPSRTNTRAPAKTNRQRERRKIVM